MEKRGLLNGMFREKGMGWNVDDAMIIMIYQGLYYQEHSSHNKKVNNLRNLDPPLSWELSREHQA